MSASLPIRQVKRPLCLLGQHNGQLPDTLLESIPGQQGGPTIRLVETAARAWKAMQAAALADGHVLKATSAADSYRPYAVQEKIFRQRYTTTPLRGRPSRSWNGALWYQKPGTAAAAVPGTSNHGLGLAVDIENPPVDWLVANETRFGFSHEIVSEPWHVHYFTGDAIPVAVLNFEHEEEDMATWKDWSDAEKMEMVKAVTDAVEARLSDTSRIPGNRMDRAVNASERVAKHFQVPLSG